MDSSSQFSPSQARQPLADRAADSAQAVLAAPCDSSVRCPPHPRLSTARQLHYSLAPLPQCSLPATNDRRKSALLPQNCHPFRSRTFVLAVAELSCLLPDTDPTRLQILHKVARYAQTSLFETGNPCFKTVPQTRIWAVHSCRR
jgi:hypothetical protein